MKLFGYIADSTIKYVQNKVSKLLKLHLLILLFDEAMLRDNATQPTPEQNTVPKKSAEAEPTQTRQTFEEFIKSLPDSVVQSRSREDLFVQYRDSLGLA